MKNFILFTLASILLSTAQAKAVTTVEYVDLTRYVGQWYEIASMPQWFQKQCVGDVTANYKTLPNGRVQVINSCLTNKGTVTSTTGEAKITDSKSNSKLRVTFAKIFRKYIYTFGGDYWIIDLEPNYNYAVIGHPTLEYGWILARQPSLPDQDLLAIEANLKKQGYDTCKFLTTVQNGGLDKKMPLCEYLKGKQ